MRITSLMATKNINQGIRKEISDFMKEIRCGMYKYKDAEPKCPCDYCEEEGNRVNLFKGFLYALWISILMIIIIFVIFNIPAHAQEYSDIQIVKAIYQAEGGSHAKFPYGIRSIKCSTNSGCYRICLTTVNRNRSRFHKINGPAKGDFIAYLGARYCPTKGKISRREIEVNQYWVKNVKYFLRRISYV